MKAKKNLSNVTIVTQTKHDSAKKLEDRNPSNYIRITPLHYAVTCGQFEICQYIIYNWCQLLFENTELANHQCALQFFNQYGKETIVPPPPRFLDIPPSLVNNISSRITAIIQETSKEPIHMFVTTSLLA